MATDDAKTMLANKLRAGSSIADYYAKQVGPEAEGIILPFVTHEIAEVRFVALVCLQAIESEKGLLHAVPALLDPADLVAARALGMLRDRVRKSLQPELKQTLTSRIAEVYPKVTSPAHRGDLGVILGDLGASSALLRSLRQNETDPDALSGLDTSLAKLGDPDGQEGYAKLITESQGIVQGRALLHAKEMAGPWIVQLLRERLGDEGPVFNTGYEDSKEFAQVIRACDVAVETLFAMLHKPTSFSPRKMANYTDAEILAMRDVADEYLRSQETGGK